MPEFENIFYQKKTGYKEDKNLGFPGVVIFRSSVQGSSVLFRVHNSAFSNSKRYISGSVSRRIKSSFAVLTWVIF